MHWPHPISVRAVRVGGPCRFDPFRSPTSAIPHPSPPTGRIRLTGGRVGEPRGAWPRGRIGPAAQLATQAVWFQANRIHEATHPATKNALVRWLIWQTPPSGELGKEVPGFRGSALTRAPAEPISHPRRNRSNTTGNHGWAAFAGRADQPVSVPTMEELRCRDPHPRPAFPTCNRSRRGGLTTQRHPPLHLCRQSRSQSTAGHSASFVLIPSLTARVFPSA